jgi:succinyl-CoA synthetase alpha subunit
MGIILNKDTKVIVQGITGKAGSMHTMTMLEYGTQVVGGVRPGAGGEIVHGVPVFDTVYEAVKATGANSSVLFVPPAAALDAALEAFSAGIRLVVAPPENIPLHSEVRMVSAARRSGATLIGPNTAGIIDPELKVKIGFVPNGVFSPGKIGIASRSGTLMYEMASRISSVGLGESTCIGVGGDPVQGLRFSQACSLFEEDKDTAAILIIGEIGGSQEEEVASMVLDGSIKKPVIAYMAGRYAPKGRKMGHAGAIVSGSRGSIDEKIAAFKKAGITVGSTPGETVKLIEGEM